MYGRFTFKVVPILSQGHAMKRDEGVEVMLQAFIISALDGGEWLPSDLPGRFIPGQGTPI